MSVPAFGVIDEMTEVIQGLTAEILISGRRRTGRIQTARPSQSGKVVIHLQMIPTGRPYWYKFVVCGSSRLEDCEDGGTRIRSPRGEQLTIPRPNTGIRLN